MGTGIPSYQNYQTTKLPSYQATKLPNYQATKLPNYANARSKPTKSFTDFEVCFLLKWLGAELSLATKTESPINGKKSVDTCRNVLLLIYFYL